jgi:hypothetical protein
MLKGVGDPFMHVSEGATSWNKLATAEGWKIEKPLVIDFCIIVWKSHDRSARFGKEINTLDWFLRHIFSMYVAGQAVKYILHTKNSPINIEPTTLCTRF